MHFVTSVLLIGVNSSAARPRSQQEGPVRVAECPPRVKRSGAHGRSLLTHGGGRDASGAAHFRAPFADLPFDAMDVAVLGSWTSPFAPPSRIERCPSSSRR